MPSFRDRPLTWLFLAATVCIDVCLPLLETRRYSVGTYLSLGLLTGQIWLAGAWLILGTSHRLLRGAVSVVAIVLITMLVAISLPGAQFTEALPAMSVMGGAAALGSLSVVLVSIGLRKTASSGLPLRFPVVELFGWMIVVAIGSWAASSGNYSRLGNVPRSLLFATASSMTVGIAAALLTTGPATSRLSRKLSALVVVAAFLVIAALSGGVQERDLYYGVHCGMAYLGLLALVMAIERSCIRGPAAED